MGKMKKISTKRAKPTKKEETKEIEQVDPKRGVAHGDPVCEFE